MQIKGLQDIVNRLKAEHLLLKEERETERQRGDMCAHAKRENRKRFKMVTRGQKSLGVGVACPLKGPETKGITIGVETAAGATALWQTWYSSDRSHQLFIAPQLRACVVFKALPTEC